MVIIMTIYEVAYWDGDGYDSCRISFGFYSTREKAENILNWFFKYDEYEDCNKYFIQEHTVDFVPDWVRKRLKRVKENYDFDHRED